MKSLFKLASLPLAILIGLFFGILSGAFFGYPNMGAAVGLALGISAAIAIGSFYLISFFDDH
ncbi:MAG: hypothetical protein CBC38_06390 [Gammaproteobacteria bacterium TMED78]|nr:MAG: hypothetical protein CBC38_06390 [Gammaproteobacteria bacterium TMED78]